MFNTGIQSRYVKHGDGSASIPSSSFISSTTTGMFLATTNTIGFSTNAISRATISTTLFTSTLPVSITDSTASTSTGSGSITTAGGLGISNTTDALSFSNGGTITTAGGVGIGKRLFVQTETETDSMSSNLYLGIQDYAAPVQSNIFYGYDQQTILYPTTAGGMGNATSASYNAEYVFCGASVDDAAAANAGAVYVFVRKDITWTLEQKLLPSVSAGTPQMGTSVGNSYNGIYLATGALNDDTIVTNGGAVYIFSRVGTVWSEDTILYPNSNGSISPNFGCALGLSAYGNYLIIGAREDDTAGTSFGAMYYFRRDGITWTLKQFITPSVATTRWGTRACISSDGVYMAASGPLTDIVGTDAGIVIVYIRSGDVWTEQQILYPSITTGSPNFGDSVALSYDGTYLVVGAPLDDVAGASAGAVYVFVRNDQIWTEQQILYPTIAGGGFGSSVSISSNNQYITIGADTSNSSIGLIYIYTRASSVWVLERIVPPSITAGSPGFGSSCAISQNGQYFFGGAQGDDIVASGAGAVYVFENNSNISIPVGDSTGPSLSFLGDTQTGLFSSALGNISFATTGSTALNLSFNDISSSRHLVPMTDSTYDLGSGSNYWRNIFVDTINSATGSFTTGLFGDGSSVLPSISFFSDQDIGFYRIGANNLGVSIGGTGYISMSTTSALVINQNSTTAFTISSGAANYLVIDTSTATGQVLNSSGSAALPGVSFVGDSNTGMHNPVGDTLAFSTAGTTRLSMSTTTLTSTLPTTITTTNAQALLVEDAAGNNVLSIDSSDAATTQMLAIEFHTQIGSNAAQNHAYIYLDDARTMWIRGLERSSDSTNIIQLQNAANTNVVRLYATNLFYTNCATTVWKNSSAAFNIKASEIDSGGATIFNIDSSTAAGQTQCSTGTAAIPGISFLGDSNTGLYNTADLIGFSTNGVSRLTISTTAFISTLPISTTNATATTSTTTGSIIASGGVGIAGSLSLGGGITHGMRVVSTTQAVLDSDYMLRASGTITLSLPAISTAQPAQEFFIVNEGVATITIDTADNATFNDGATASITLTVQYQFVRLLCNGATDGIWYY